MKLYEIKLPARIHCKCSDGSAFVDVDHLDGMYSFGRTENGGIVHISAFEELTQRPEGDWQL